MNLSITFTAEIWHWRGPAPFFFVTIPEAESLMIKDVSKVVSYGWGAIPVSVRIGETNFKTAIFPKDGRYVVPVKADVRKAEGLEEGSEVEATLEI